jgi:hypothetical protein
MRSAAAILPKIKNVQAPNSPYKDREGRYYGKYTKLQMSFQLNKYNFTLDFSDHAQNCYCFPLLFLHPIEAYAQSSRLLLEQNVGASK